MARMTMQMEVSCRLRHDEQTSAFVSHCPELNLCSAGNTELEAVEAVRSAITLFLRWVYERRQLDEILAKMGLQFMPASQPIQWGVESSPGVEVGSVAAQSVPIQVPFYLLAQDAQSIQGA